MIQKIQLKLHRCELLPRDTGIEVVKGQISRIQEIDPLESKIWSNKHVKTLKIDEATRMQHQNMKQKHATALPR